MTTLRPWAPRTATATVKTATAIAIASALGLTVAGCTSPDSGPHQVSSVVVPNVVGGQLRPAAAVLARAHLRCRPDAYGSRRPLGTVVTQSPAAGTKDVPGATVTVDYSVGDGGVSVPVMLSCPLPTTTVPSRTALRASPSGMGGGQRQSAAGLLPAWPQLHDRLVVTATQRAAGAGSIAGTLIVVNDGRKTVNLNTGCGPSFVVVLTNSGYTPTVAFATDCDIRPFLIAPGVTRLAFTIATTYLSCGLGRNTASHPTCRGGPGGGLPPLPAGRYSAVLRADGLALPPPAPVTLTLTG